MPTGQIVNQKPRGTTARPVSPLSADAQRVLDRIPVDWSGERELRRAIHQGLFLQISAIAQILNALERRNLIIRGQWMNGDRQIRRGARS